jgi:RNase P subunit RPR2
MKCPECGATMVIDELYGFRLNGVFCDYVDEPRLIWVCCQCGHLDRTETEEEVKKI